MATMDAQLTSFNRQLQQRQEEAYTLAYYLVGSAEAAAQVVQNAALQAFQRIHLDRLHLLRLVIECCKNRKAASTDPLAGREASLRDKFLALPPEERSAVLLVDVLGLSYVEAAQVLGTNTSRLSERLAHGRMLSMGL